MAIVRANPDQYLLVGRAGRLENRGTAVQAFLLPGAVWVLIPASKQEAAFEFTQETRDGIPLRFKGIVIYRVTDPVAAARLFDFADGRGAADITKLLTHICLGELRHAVSHMTMVECIEQRKTTLSGTVADALERTIAAASDEAGSWGITVEVAQVAQVFIVDAQLRQQLEAEVRNEIKLKSDQSTIQTQEETRLSEMASAERIDEQKVASDQQAVLRAEALELAELAREQRVKVERAAAERQALQLEQERLHAALTLEEDRANSEAPVRLLEIAKEREVLAEDVEMRLLRNRVRELEVEHEMLLSRAQHSLRREMLPLEQAPQIVESASKILNGTNLSIYGEDGRLVGQLAPFLDIIGRAVAQAAPSDRPAGPTP